MDGENEQNYGKKKKRSRFYMFYMIFALNPSVNEFSLIYDLIYLQGLLFYLFFCVFCSTDPKRFRVLLFIKV